MGTGDTWRLIALRIRGVVIPLLGQLRDHDSDRVPFGRASFLLRASESTWYVSEWMSVYDLHFTHMSRLSSDSWSMQIQSQ